MHEAPGIGVLEEHNSQRISVRGGRKGGVFNLNRQLPNGRRARPAEGLDEEGGRRCT